MKLLLDECVTNYLKPDFAGHEVSTIDDAGFKGLKNGKLLEAASTQFDVLITVGGYRSNSMLINTGGVQLDANMADFRLPPSMR